MSLKLKKTNFYDDKGNAPEFVEFNDEKISYDEALKSAEMELFEMFSRCFSYEDARKIITTNDDVFSEDKGFITSKGTTGRLYTEWLVLWGNDAESAIYWDVRSY